MTKTMMEETNYKNGTGGFGRWKKHYSASVKEERHVENRDTQKSVMSEKSGGADSLRRSTKKSGGLYLKRESSNFRGRALVMIS